ncbi:MAG: ATP-binding protein [Burkholderiales bacterium]|nr:ATP-binding protein [Burkholderiales bacterium]
MNTPKLVCLMGAESTGKTTLAQALAARFSCPWVPEYLRSFCQAHQRTPQRHEQSLILETQHIHVLAAREDAARHGAPFVFCDTAPLLTAIYSEDVFGDASLLPRGRTLQRIYALTLLCEADLEWAADGFMRDGPAAQARIQTALARELATPGRTAGESCWQVIRGKGASRADAAIHAILALPGAA